MDGLREELDAKKHEIAALQDRCRHEYLQYRVACQSVVGNGNRAHRHRYGSRGSARSIQLIGATSESLAHNRRYRVQSKKLIAKDSQIGDLKQELDQLSKLLNEQRQHGNELDTERQFAVRMLMHSKLPTHNGPNEPAGMQRAGRRCGGRSSWRRSWRTSTCEPNRRSRLQTARSSSYAMLSAKWNSSDTNSLTERKPA